MDPHRYRYQLYITYYTQNYENMQVLFFGDPYEIRTRVAGVRGRSLRPLDQRAKYIKANALYSQEQDCCLAPINVGNDLFYREVALQVSTARMSLTTVFGMGTGVTSSLLSPNERDAYFITRS